MLSAEDTKVNIFSSSYPGEERLVAHHVAKAQACRVGSRPLAPPPEPDSLGQCQQTLRRVQQIRINIRTSNPGNLLTLVPQSLGSDDEPSVISSYDSLGVPGPTRGRGWCMGEASLGNFQQF